MLLPCPIHSAAVAALAVVLVVVVVAVLAARRNTEAHKAHEFFEWCAKSAVAAAEGVTVESTDAGTPPVYQARDPSGKSPEYAKSGGFLGVGGSYAPLTELEVLQAMAGALAKKGAASLVLTKNRYEPAVDAAGAPTGKLYLASVSRKIATAAEIQDDIAKATAAPTTPAPA